MAKDTKIGWATATTNFWTGCEKVSPGCKNCYMYRWANYYYPGRDASKVQRTGRGTFYRPSYWKEAERIFVNSLSDFFMESPQLDTMRKNAWEVMKLTPKHKYMILTKRPENIEAMLPPDFAEWQGDRIWIGISAEDETCLIRRCEHFEKAPVKNKFLSLEPLLEDIDIIYELVSGIIDWVIVGGESGFGNQPSEPGRKFQYRECKQHWIGSIIADCDKHSIPVFVKQLGTHLCKELNMRGIHGDDIEHPNFPNYLKRQEFPKELEL